MIVHIYLQQKGDFTHVKTFHSFDIQYSYKIIDFFHFSIFANQKGKVTMQRATNV